MNQKAVYYLLFAFLITWTACSNLKYPPGTTCIPSSACWPLD